MERLESVDYPRARPLFTTERLRLSIEALIAGNSTGALWADSRIVPRTALVWDGGGSIAFLGDAGNVGFNDAAAEYIATSLAPRLRQLKIRYTDPSWERQMAALFAGMALSKAGRVLYSLGRLAIPDWRNRIPDGFVIRAIDGALLADDTLANIVRLRAEVTASWPFVERYLARGFGHCAMHGNEIVGWCDGALASPGRISVTIEIVESYRRRGLATLMACAFVERCLREQVAPCWDAWSDNWASIATAERVGLARIAEYPIYVATRREAC